MSKKADTNTQVVNRFGKPVTPSAVVHIDGLGDSLPLYSRSVPHPEGVLTRNGDPAKCTQFSLKPDFSEVHGHSVDTSENGAAKYMTVKEKVIVTDSEGNSDYKNVTYRFYFPNGVTNAQVDIISDMRRAFHFNEKLVKFKKLAKSIRSMADGKSAYNLTEENAKPFIQMLNDEYTTTVQYVMNKLAVSRETSGNKRIKKVAPLAF